MSKSEYLYEVSGHELFFDDFCKICRWQWQNLIRTSRCQLGIIFIRDIGKHGITNWEEKLIIYSYYTWIEMYKDAIWTRRLIEHKKSNYYLNALKYRSWRKFVINFQNLLLHRKHVSSHSAERENILVIVFLI